MAIVKNLRDCELEVDIWEVIGERVIERASRVVPAGGTIVVPDECAHGAGLRGGLIEQTDNWELVTDAPDKTTDAASSADEE